MKRIENIRKIETTTDQNKGECAVNSIEKCERMILGSIVPASTKEMAADNFGSAPTAQLPSREDNTPVTDDVAEKQYQPYLIVKQADQNR